MKKKGILLIAVILLSLGGLVQAQEKKLSGTIDVTYLSRYIWRGVDWFHDNRGAIQPSIDLDLWDTGFGLKVVSTMAIGSGRGPVTGNMQKRFRPLEVGYQNLERWAYTLYYYNTFDEQETWATDYKFGWTYYNLPDSSRNLADMQEIFASFSWPKIFPAGVVPSYTAFCIWPSGSGSVGNRAARAGSKVFGVGSGSIGGWIHVFGLGYDLPIQTEGLLPNTPEQILHLSTDFVYNDGALAVDHEWSHAVFGISTDFDLGNNFTFTPGVYYQSSWNDSVNTQDETWVTLGMKYEF